jgi:hypothetical protein
VRPPVIVDSDIERLLVVPKPVDDIDWRQTLLPPKDDGFVRRAWLDLGEVPAVIPLRGTLRIYTRQGVNPEIEDWSTGLVYFDYADNSWPVVRCNGPHPQDHVNRIEGTAFARQPHVHRLTERYQRKRGARGDHYAEPTTAFRTLPEAIEYLAMLSNLEPAGRLFL